MNHSINNLSKGRSHDCHMTYDYTCGIYRELSRKEYFKLKQLRRDLRQAEERYTAANDAGTCIYHVFT